jgi:hypothetical protein
LDLKVLSDRLDLSGLPEPSDLPDLPVLSDLLGRQPVSRDLPVLSGLSDLREPSDLPGLPEPLVLLDRRVPRERRAEERSFRSHPVYLLL